MKPAATSARSVRPFRPGRSARLVALAVAGCAVFWLARNFVMFSYYEETVAVLDGGWFAGLLSGGDWKLSNPPVVDENGGSYYRVHVAPLLVPFSYLGKVLPLEAGEYMAAFFGFAFAAYAAVLFVAAADFLSQSGTGGATHPPLRPGLIAVVAAIVAVVLSLNGVSAEILHYPHFEIWIPVLVCAFLSALAFNKNKAAVALFAVLMSTREDAGFHLAVTLSAIVFFRQCGAGKSVVAQRESLRAQKGILLWSAVAIVFSLVAINVGGMQAPRPTVFDERIWSRLASVLFRGDWVLALVVAAGWAVVSRRPSVLIGFAACVPWMIFSVPQEHPLRAHMASYYGFPVLVAFFWPFVAGRFFPGGEVAGGAGKRRDKKRGDKKRAQSSSPTSFTPPSPLAAAAFAMLFAASTLPLRPVQSVEYGTMRVPKVGLSQLLENGATPPSSQTRENIRKLRMFFESRADELNIITADGFASLHPHLVPASRLLYRGPLKLEQDDAGVLIAHRTWLSLFIKSVYAARAAFGLRNAYILSDTGFFLFSKAPLCEGAGAKCVDDLPLERATLGPSYDDIAATELSRDSFYFPAPTVAADGANVEDKVIVAARSGVAAELRGIPLPAGQTALAVEYFYAATLGTPPRFEAQWNGGGVAADLPPVDGDRGAAARMMVELRQREKISARVVHNGGGTLKIFGMSARPANRGNAKP